MLKLNKILNSSEFSYLTLINTNVNLDREIHTIESTETPDVAEYLPKHTLLLTTGMVFKDDPQLFCSFIESLDQLPIAGLGIKLGRYIEEVPQEVVDYANQLDFPLIEIPKDRTLGDVSHHLLSYLWGNESGTIQMALNLQKQFSEMMLKGASIGNLIKYLGTVLKVPLVLENPFFEIIATSQHYNSGTKYTIDEYEKDNIEFLNDKKRSYLDNGKKKSFENKTYYVHPIKIDRYFNYYLVLRKEHDTAFLFSNIMLEQASVILSHTIYKNLKLVEEKVNAKQSFITRLINSDNKEDYNINWYNYGSEFDLIPSDHYQMIICKYNNSISPLTSLESEKIRFNLIFSWFKKHINYLENDILLFPSTINNTFLILLQKENKEIESEFKKINTLFNKSTLDNFKFYFGNPVSSLNDVHYSYKEALDVYESESSEALFNYYITKDLKDLLYYVPQHVQRQFVQTILKELTYPDNNVDLELRETLKVYLGAQGEIKRTAELLFIHRNTVKYRIAKCKELLGVDLEDPTDILNIRTALEIVEEL